MSDNKSKKTALFVDLDGTLIRTDTLLESIILLLKSHPQKIVSLPVWLFMGKTYFKNKVSKYTTLRTDMLPYREKVIDFINKEKGKGREVYLLTAANQKIADNVANHLGLFTGAFGSNDKINLLGKHKLERVYQIIGNAQFDYVGNSVADIPIWEKANKKIVVNPTKNTKKKIKKFDNLYLIPTNRNVKKIKPLIKGLRIYQWAKNSLLFLPTIMAHQFTNANSLVAVFWAFVSFSLCASAVYILNDLLDIETDRAHPTKKNRPLASGLMSIKTGVLLIILLVLISIFISIKILSVTFLIILLIYMISTTAYSIILKQIMLIDVIVLGGLYTLRIAAGSIASGIEVSSWLLVFSMFFFLSLAFMKRYADLILMKQNNYHEIAGRGYNIDDLDLVQKSGITSGFVAMLVLALYINSEHVVELYKSPILIWLTVPVLLYWLMRMWMVTNRGNMTDDPINYAIRDKATYVAMIIIGIIMLLAATINNSIFNNLNIIQ
ncbi:MAG: UbiA family prenyltransferase [Planctomycetia bacterium]|nr:UbiA family prenyltransferase [Planctomycetia bacterium]